MCVCLCVCACVRACVRVCIEIRTAKTLLLECARDVLGNVLRSRDADADDADDDDGDNTEDNDVDNDDDFRRFVSKRAQSAVGQEVT